ncbi:MAG: caspase family protein [Burkholderiales bacterium]
MTGIDLMRRRVLRGGVAAGTLFLPLPYASLWAQSEGALKLLRLPKVALLVGNGAYKAVPPLKNPANDARAMADALKASGFEVTIKLDASREEMLAAMQAYAQTLGAKKCVGLFYFAGHGLQLAWRNYLVPMDAAIGGMDDVARQCVDVSSLVEGITKAANPMNLIILDACRENPFGRDFREAQKGLSQMDAPPATLLAYATSPGNVASDGDGANGLYTEFLLKEIKVGEAKIEDVFKRVRLGVRRKSNGAQIPWESTSLEEDFYFIPPAQLKKLSDDERERLAREEQALWAKVKDAKEAGPLEDYLRRYPSGAFAELAQFRLDRLLASQGEKKIQIASSEGNPFTKGTVTTDIKYKIGDSYTYRQLDIFSRAEQAVVIRTVERVSEDEVHYSGGLITDLLGNVRRLADGRVLTDNQNVPAEFAVGKHWVTRYQVRLPQGGEVQSEVQWRVVARESITVPAGTFNTFRCEGQGHGRHPMGPMTIKFTNWYDPERMRLPIAREELSRTAARTLLASRFELVSFKQS